MSVATRHQNFVGGEWVDAAEGETMEVINPATGEAIAEVPRGSQEDVDRAVAAAKKAFEEWRETTPAERSGMLLALADALEEHADELIEAEKANVGKPQGIVVDEVPASADNLRFFAGAARNLEGKAVGEYMRGYTSMVRREPRRRGRADRALELPADDGDLEDRARARGRQHDRPQAVRADAALDDPARALCR